MIKCWRNRVVPMLLSMCLLLTACTVDRIQTAELPVELINMNVNESGIYVYESSFKLEDNLQIASARGDIGMIIVSLNGENTDIARSANWWADASYQFVSNDLIIIAGEKGDKYSGCATCYKCGTSRAIEGVIEEDFVTNVMCDCHYDSHYYGVRKSLTVMIKVV